MIARSPPRRLRPSVTTTPGSTSTPDPPREPSPSPTTAGPTRAAMSSMAVMLSLLTCELQVKRSTVDSAAVTDLPLDVLDRVARLVGDRWSMLVVAALAGGGQRYGELAEQVTGISSNVLASRLSELVAAGLIIGEPYSPRPDRLRYERTAESRALAGL